MNTRISIISLLVILSFQISCAQDNEKSSEKEVFPFTEDNWSVDNMDGSESEIKTLEYKGKQSLQLAANQKAYLINQNAENFILEFRCNAISGPGFGFRVENKENFEYVYLRMGQSGKKDALQYLPIHNGSLPWQLYNYPKYEGKATFPRDKIASFPIALKDQLTVGKAGEEIRAILAKEGYSFSTESQVVAIDETSGYIFDPQEYKALLFEESGNQLDFRDPRTWIHIKVKVIGGTASFYIEDMDTPALVVEDLKGNPTAGGISLIGDGVDAYFAEVSLTKLPESKADKPVEKLPPNYLTKWAISKMFSKDSINFNSQIDSLLGSEFEIKAIQADKDGLINISRFYDDMTKTVALSCNLVSTSDKIVMLNFDYADHLVILLGSEVLFDKGMNFQPPPNKGTEGRVFVDDESVELSLKKGMNQLTFILSADNRQKFNWGFIAKLESLDGISVE